MSEKCSSLLDLDDKDMADWDSDASTGDIFGLDFPSPAHAAVYDEPIFWPLSNESYCSPANFVEDFLRLSPLRARMPPRADRTDPRLCKHHLGRARRNPQRKECGRRLAFGSGEKNTMKNKKKQQPKHTDGDWHRSSVHGFQFQHGVDAQGGAEGGLSLEAMVGLSEFDGREGIEDDLMEGSWFFLD